MEPVDTDNAVWVMLVEDPGLYDRALRCVFPYASASPGSEAEERLVWFVKDKINEFNKIENGPFIDEKRINFSKLFSELFL